MSAIAHGWKPSKGDVAKIPVGVAKHLHAEGASQKYGAKHKESKSYATGNKWRQLTQKAGSKKGK